MHSINSHVNWTLLAVFYLLFNCSLSAQEVIFEENLILTQDIFMGLEGSLEGNIFGLDRLVGTNDLRFFIDGQIDPSMFIDINGDVGIGTFLPSATLTVVDESREVARFSSSSTLSTAIEIENTGGGGTWNLTSNGSDAGGGANNFELFNANTGTSALIATPSGFVGLGPFFSPPNDALDVTGDIDATGCVQTDDTGSIGGTCISDLRYKENIRSLHNQLDYIMSLRPVKFDWKKEYNNGYKGDIGLIAQEVEEVLPDMVVTQKDGLKKIRYDISLQMRVITAMQEQQEIINNQEDIMQQQRQDIDMLISEVARLKELVGE